MTRRIVNNARKLVLLRWSDALDEGFCAYRTIPQPATLANLSAVIVDNHALKSYEEQFWDRSDFRDPIKLEVYRQIQRSIYKSLRSYYGDFLVSTWNVVKKEETDILIREGLNAHPHKNVTAYSVTGSGRERATEIEQEFEERAEAAKRSSHKFTWDVINLPKQTQTGWRVKELKIPRVYDGKGIETGSPLPGYG